MVKASNLDSKMEASQAKMEAESAKKTSIKIGPWDVCKSVFSAEEQKSMSLYDKSDLYFHDYNLAGLFVQQNYLSSKPVAAGGDRKKVMELVSQAADSIAEGDLVERGIRSGMNWSLLPTAAVFCSVLSGEYMSGFLTGQIEFPQWLGKNSRRSKLDRILSELQGHTRLTAGASKGAVTLDYGQRLREHIVSPMSKLGAEGVDQSVTNINDYNLLREDLDGLMEVTQWPGRLDPWGRSTPRSRPPSLESTTRRQLLFLLLSSLSSLKRQKVLPIVKSLGEKMTMMLRRKKRTKTTSRRTL